MKLPHVALLLLGMGWGCAAERPPGVRDNDRSGSANEDSADGGVTGSPVTGSSTNGASGSDDPTSGTEANDGNAGDGAGGVSVGGGTADPTDSGGANASGGASGAGAPGASGAETAPSAAGSGPDSSMPDETEPSEMEPSVAAYPPGPYGEGSPALGDVIENLSLRGLVNPTGQGLALDAEYRDFSLGELRDSGAEYAVLLMAAVWCSSCRLSTLVAGERAHEVFEAGGTVLELLLDGATSRTPPTEAELRAWADAYELPMTTVGPVNDRARQVFTDREYAYIVELETMTVVWRHNMLYGNPTIVDQAIDTFLTDFQ